MPIFNTFDNLIKSVENSRKGAPEASSHQSQSSEGMSYFLRRGDNSLQQELLGSSLAQEKQDGANIFREPLGWLLKHGCQQIGQWENLWLMVQMVKLGDEQTVAR